MSFARKLEVTCNRIPELSGKQVLKGDNPIVYHITYCFVMFVVIYFVVCKIYIKCIAILELYHLSLLGNLQMS
jgi:hypothetical protein